MSEQKRLELQQELALLLEKKETATDFTNKLEIADAIHNIQMKLTGVKPTDTHIDTTTSSLLAVLILLLAHQRRTIRLLIDMLK